MWPRWSIWSGVTSVWCRSSTAASRVDGRRCLVAHGQGPPQDERWPATGRPYDAAMSEASPATGPVITGVHHFSPTVRDVEASAAWYEQVFSLMRIPMTVPHHEREDTGYAVLLLDPVSGLLFGLHHH